MVGPRVFISFATADQAIATRLYQDLGKAGADVFEFKQSGSPGTPAWSQVLERIEQSDVFLLLVSKQSCQSPAVAAELQHAHYQLVNSKTKKPRQLIPAIVEKGVEPPMLLRRFVRLSLSDYSEGLARLIKELGLEASVPSPVVPPEIRKRQIGAKKAALLLALISVVAVLSTVAYQQCDTQKRTAVGPKLPRRVARVISELRRYDQFTEATSSVEGAKEILRTIGLTRISSANDSDHATAQIDDEFSVTLWAQPHNKPNVYGVRYRSRDPAWDAEATYFEMVIPESAVGRRP